MPFIVFLLFVPGFLIEIASVYSDVALDPSESYRLIFERYLAFDGSRIEEFRQAFPGQIGTIFLTYGLTSAGMVDFLFGSLLLLLFCAMVIDILGGFRLMISLAACSVAGAVGHYFLSDGTEVLSGMISIAMGILALQFLSLLRANRESGEFSFFPFFFVLPFIGMHFLPEAALQISALEVIYDMLDHEASLASAAMSIPLFIIYWARDKAADTMRVSRKSQRADQDLYRNR